MAYNFVFLHYKSSNLAYFLTALELQRQSYVSETHSFSVPQAMVIFLFLSNGSFRCLFSLVNGKLGSGNVCHKQLKPSPDKLQEALLTTGQQAELLRYVNFFISFILTFYNILTVRFTHHWSLAHKGPKDSFRLEEA